MSRSNYDKPFYVDVGTSIVAVRCASNHDVILEYNCSRNPALVKRAEAVCDRMNKEAEIGRPRRNCDVGTALEQSERFMDFCRPGNRPPNCEKCKVYPKRMNKFWCQLEWAQMPYEADEKGEVDDANG